MKTNQHNFQLLVTDVQAISKEQEKLNIEIPVNGKSDFIFTLAINVKKNHPFLDDFRHHFKGEMADANYERVGFQEFLDEYPILLQVNELLKQNQDDATEKKIKLIVGNTTFNYQDLHVKLFNLLIVEVSLNENPEYVDLLISSIKVLKLLEEIERGNVSKKEDILELFGDLKVLLPKEIFPIKKKDVELTSDDSTDIFLQNQKKEEALVKEISTLIKTREEIDYCFEQKIENKKSEILTETEFCENMNQENGFDENSPTPSVDCATAYQKYLEQAGIELLDQACYGKLTKEAKKGLTDLGFKIGQKVSVRHLFKIIDRRIEKLTLLLKPKLKSDKIVRIGSSVISINHDAFEEQICGKKEKLSHCDLLKSIRENIPASSLVQILGIGHHQVIRDEHVGYVSTSMAHNEPIMQGEKKERVYVNKKMTEVYSETETEREEENTTDTKTTDRFELSKEMEKENKLNQEFDAGVKVTSLGTVKVEASANYAVQSANAQKSKTSVKNAQETVSRSLNRVKERVREFRSTKTINEIENRITHSIDNSTGANANGWFQYIDEIREFGVYDIGKRLILRIIVPVPAAFDIYAASQALPEGLSIEKPIHPSDYESSTGKTLKSFEDIDRTNFGEWAAVYDAQDIDSPPEEFLTVAKAYRLDYQEDGKMWHSYAYNDLQVKDGYEAIHGEVNVQLSGGNQYISGYLGNRLFSTWHGSRKFPLNLHGEDGVVPLSFRGYYNEFCMNVEVLTKLTKSAYQKWQIDTFNSIMNAYAQKKAEFDNQMSMLDIQEGIKIEGRNPRINKKIISTAIDRGCIDMLTKGGYRGYETVKYARTGEPETDYGETMRQIPFLSFFNNAFEWHNKTYVFEPWYWNTYNKWKVVKQFSDPDMLFQNFIQAGAAIVDLPVRPPYTQAVLNFINTGDIWTFADMPTLNDPLHVSVIQMIKDDQKQTGGILVGNKWKETIPTSGVIVKDLPAGL